MSDHVAVVTGGTGALGRALVPPLADRGFRIAVTYLVPDEAEAFERVVDLDEDRLLLRRVDCTDSAAVEAFFTEAVSTFGGLNVLATLVGGWAGGRDVRETDDLRFDRMLDLNLRTTFHALRSGIPHLVEAEWGRIVAVGSRAAVDTPTGQAAFNAAKAGVVALVETVANELEGTEVTANIVMPSVIDTETTRAAVPYANYMQWPKPGDIATVIDFLCDPASHVINGAAIPVHGKA